MSTRPPVVSITRFGRVSLEYFCLWLINNKYFLSYFVYEFYDNEYNNHYIMRNWQNFECSVLNSVSFKNRIKFNYVQYTYNILYDYKLE